MKKIKIMLLTIICICSIFTTTGTAEYVSDVVVSMQIDNPVMHVNGVETAIDSDNTTPIVRNDVTLVPIRAIVEAFGGEVSWDNKTQTVELSMNDNTIKLTIDNRAAYLNNSVYTLDTEPVIINERTMLPIRFIAEGFNLGVAWEGDTRTVSIIRNEFEQAEYDYLMSVLPAYSGSPYAVINNNVPLFKNYEIIGGSFEYYSELDNLGRCDVTMASVGTDIMPTDKRGDISSVYPTGWVNKSYDIVDGGYLYNRCHLIGYQLSGENANSRNLITGTRYMNVSGMLPFENMIDDYVEATDNHVMYRVTPVFKGDNLVADGVLMEAYSVEDKGKGVSFCVYCYNVQPGILINYATGDNNQTETVTPIKESVSGAIYRTPTGKRYHLDPYCGGKNSYKVTYDEAVSAGLTPCKKCAN